MLEKLPLELRIKIYEYVYADLIEDLSDNLFGVFSMYDYLYDYTVSHLESHVGKTGLTALLSTCKEFHGEALETLCNDAELVLDLLGDDDNLDEERANIRFSEDNKMLTFAKNLKLNVEPDWDRTTNRFVSRIHRFLGVIDHGARLRSLKIRIAPGKSSNPKSFDKILSALGGMRTAGNAVEVSLGEVPEWLISPTRLEMFLEQVNGINKGRGRQALQPKRYEDGDDSDDEA
ncbi:hypothetical protein F5Y16DRAFT_362865 [Xylariaceae sp. FL0255]|nr:hypothetical protein F5Y16DRAFT_362865 [Xylariaceae sp. FL0255]